MTEVQSRKKLCVLNLKVAQGRRWLLKNCRVAICQRYTLKKCAIAINFSGKTDWKPVEKRLTDAVAKDGANDFPVVDALAKADITNDGIAGHFSVADSLGGISGQALTKISVRVTLKLACLNLAEINSESGQGLEMLLTNFICARIEKINAVQICWTRGGNKIWKRWLTAGRKAHLPFSVMTTWSLERAGEKRRQLAWPDYCAWFEDSSSQTFMCAKGVWSVIAASMARSGLKSETERVSVGSCPADWLPAGSPFLSSFGPDPTPELAIVRAAGI